MEQLGTLWADHPYYVVGAVTAPVMLLLFKKFCGGNERPKIDCPANTVLLYQLSRGPYAPSMSPFPLKLETFLRMANIPYINDLSGQFSPKGKTPFMSYNGEIVSDSQFCIEYLNKKLGIDLNKDLSKEERAVAKAIQILVDEHLLWTLVYHRWVYDKEMKILSIGLPEMKYTVWLLKRNYIKALHGQGLGRHTPEEIKHIMMDDLQALADFLDNKPFIMGQAASEVDCSVFGMLSQFIWNTSDDVCTNIVQEKFPSLYNYCLRVKEQFWPDWDDCITHGGTRPATK